MVRTWDFIAKIVMIGDSACGKSSLTIRLTDDRFSDVHDVTIAAEIGSKIIAVGEPVDGRQHYMKLQIWDTAGQEHFRAVTRSYFRNAAGCILVYDVTRRQTLENAKMWLRDIRELANEDISICLVGNKSDLEDQRQVPAEEARQWAEENGIEHFVETSAKTGHRVVEAYTEVAQQIHTSIIQGRVDLADKSQGIKVNSATTGLINLNASKQKSEKSSCC
ncbi:GTP-binding protein Ypt1p [Trichomonascus vanleenenianus]|uniref:Rab family GTPase n=1 Tax=Trichomonascus vanleenenianus TaxID=2268995 RepID=UPI003ECA92D2